MAAAISGRFEIAPRNVKTFFVSVCWIVGARTVFKNHGDAAGCSDARDGRRWEGESDTVGIARKLLLQIALNVFELLRFALADSPGLEIDERRIPRWYFGLA